MSREAPFRAAGSCAVSTLQECSVWPAREPAGRAQCLVANTLTCYHGKCFLYRMNMDIHEETARWCREARRATLATIVNVAARSRPSRAGRRLCATMT